MRGAEVGVQVALDDRHRRPPPCRPARPSRCAVAQTGARRFGIARGRVGEHQRRARSSGWRIARPWPTMPPIDRPIQTTGPRPHSRISARGVVDQVVHRVRARRRAPSRRGRGGRSAAPACSPARRAAKSSHMCRSRPSAWLSTTGAPRRPARATLQLRRAEGVVRRRRARRRPAAAGAGSAAFARAGSRRRS